MLSSLLPYAAGVVAVVAIWAIGLGRLGVLTPADLRAWRRLAALRGLAGKHTRLERVAERVSAVRRVQEELDLERLLAMAGRPESPSGFVAHTGALAFAAFGSGIVLATVLRFGSSAYQISPWLIVLMPVAVVLWQFSRLRAHARKRRQLAGRTLGDMMMLVAVLTDGRGLQIGDAVRILSRCARSAELETLLASGSERLLGPERRSTLDAYRLIAERYGIAEFAAVTEAIANTNVGMAERDTYTRVAQSVYQQRLAEARQHAARARILVTLPVAGMLIPLLLLLGAPTFATISSGLGGH